MSIYKMNTVQIIKFVELYREAECLWSIKSEGYKDQNKRDEALKKINEEMNIDGFGIREVAQKIKNIRSAYYQELRKIKNSQKSGAGTHDIYQPKVPWFSIVHSFLKSNAEIAGTDSSFPYCKLSQQGLAEECSECVDENPANIVEKNEENSAKRSRTMEDFKIPVKKRRLQEPPAYIGEAIEKLEQIQSNLSSETEFDI